MDILGKGVHGAQLVDVNDLTVLAQTALAEDRAVRGTRVATRLPGFLGNEIIDAGDGAQADDLEAAIIETPQDLGARKDPLFTARKKEINTLQHRQLGHDALVDKIHDVKDAGEPAGKFTVNPLAALVIRFKAAYEHPAFFQFIVQGDEDVIDVAEIVHLFEVEEQAQRIVLKNIDVENIGGKQVHRGEDIESAKINVFLDEIEDILELLQEQALEFLP